MFHDDQLFNDNLTDEELEKLLKKIEEEDQDSQPSESKDRLSATQPLTAEVIEHQNKPIDCSDTWINQLLDDENINDNPKIIDESIVSNQSIEPSKQNMDQVDFSDFNIEPEVEEIVSIQDQILTQQAIIPDQVQSQKQIDPTTEEEEGFTNNELEKDNDDDFELPDHFLDSQNNQIVNPSVNEQVIPGDDSIYNVDSFLSAELDPVKPMQDSVQQKIHPKSKNLESSLEPKANINNLNTDNIKKEITETDNLLNNDHVAVNHIGMNLDEPRYYKKSKDLQKSADDIHVKIRLLKSQLKNVRDVFGQLTETSADIISDIRYLQNQTVDDFSVSYEQMHELRKTIIQTRKELGDLTSKIDLVEEAMESDLYVAETRNV